MIQSLRSSLDTSVSYRYELGPIIDHYIILKNVNKPYTQIFKPLYTQQSDIVINQKKTNHPEMR